MRIPLILHGDMSEHKSPTIGVRLDAGKYKFVLENHIDSDIKFACTPSNPVDSVSCHNGIYILRLPNVMHAVIVKRGKEKNLSVFAELIE